MLYPSGSAEGWLMRRLNLMLALAFGAAPCAHAELTCAQVGKTILATIEYRDQGFSLSQVIGSVDKLKSTNQFTDEELEKLRVIVKLSYLQSRSPQEILEACEEDAKEKAKAVKK